MDINDNYQVIFTKQSQKEINCIYQYISKTLCAKISTLQLMKEINSKVINLTIFPRLYCELKIPNSKGIEYRRIVVKNYIVIYRVNDRKKEIYLLHIFHSKSDYQRKLYSKFFSLN